ncbi:MAG: TonB-dependent receptor [Brevundimonas sp.]|uniref:TonB-dependent receptor n=1 Tax=Brevundimonas sp. TaxID=1871086 RepID=UPI001212BBD4|nr:TonB-dependent receptor [Brevundimonas sp.]RZJ17725.1 MAG: TonB-dependent receptor [Brevundimonas sp.]
MSTKTNTKYWLGAASALAVAISLASAGAATAQVASSTLRGAVSDNGQAEPGARVTATEIATGFTARATVNAQGNYVLAGLRPGTYRIQVTTDDGRTTSEDVVLAVGQSAVLDLDVPATAVAVAPGATDLGDVVVTGRRLIEVKTSEVATNVSTEQINNLPQNSRNFLNFAALAPGVTVSDNPERKVFSSGALSANNTNVFIDGQSLKNNVTQGGLAGQDSSRGNPFPQAAIQEFRVSTQNHKAEYEQAGAAVITAVTRSGTNDFQGELFGYYQDKGLTSPDYFDERNGAPQPEYERQQYGGWVGGPILRDRLHYFLSYEANNQDRATRVDLNDAIPQAIRDQYEGNFVVPFRSELYFGKLSWTPADNHTVDLSVTRRDETDVRGFGGGTTRDRAEDITVQTTSANLRWSWSGGSFLNEASIDYLDASWAPSAVSGARSVKTDNGDLQVGARTFTQDKGQTGLTLRNDFTFLSLGDHLVKIGGKVAFIEYEAVQFEFFNPEYTYANGDYTFAGDPIRARVGLGDPLSSGDNTQIGLYIQDDWDVTDKLQLNLGLRWDYESNMLNNDFVTPAALAAAVRAWANNRDINWEEYISDGNNRDSFTGAFQPRIGFSYDVYDDASLVVFGGAGRYYDRVLYDYAQVEYAKSNYRVYEVQFNGATPWSDAYYDKDALLALVTGGAGGAEAYMLSNDVKLPYSDQFSLGVRKTLGQFNTALTYSHINSYDGFSWVLANRYADGSFRDANNNLPWGQAPAGYSNIIVSESKDESSYDALFLTIDKPYTRDSGWGMNFAWTFADAEEYGARGPYALDEPDAAAWGWHPAEAAERHRIVFSAIKDMAWGITGSTLITLGTGQRYEQVRDNVGGGVTFLPGGGEPEKFDFIIPDAFAFRQVDFRFSKDFGLPNQQQISVILDVINAFNFKNYGYETWVGGFIPRPGNVNANFGEPSRLTGPTRSFQIGLRYSF